MPVNELAVHIEEDAEAKGKEARQSAFQLGAIAILSAPLAIFLPLDPLLISPVVELAPHTMQAGEQASRLKEQAAQMRRDAACAMRPGYVDVAEDLRRALAEQAMRRAIVEELSDALSRRTRLPVTLVDAPPPTDLGTDSFPFVEQARAQGLPSVVSVEIVALDLSPEAIGVESTSCRYKVTASAELTWWDVDRHTLVGRSVLDQVPLPMAAFDLSALLRRPDQLRIVVARAFRNLAAETFKRGSFHPDLDAGGV